MKAADLLFRRTVREIMGPAPVCVPLGTSCEEVARLLSEPGRRLILVGTPEGPIHGQVAVEDVADRIAFRAGSGTAVEQIMRRPVEAIEAAEEAFRAFLRVGPRRGVLTVLENGRPIGVFEPGSALITLIDQILPPMAVDSPDASLDSVEALRRFQVILTGRLLAAGEPARDTLSAITAVNNSILRRILTKALADMKSEGWGEPPVRFTVVAMGSWGRGECSLGSDQDLGFILEPYRDSAHLSIDRFFIEVADRLTRNLDRVGIPYCPGDVMPTSPLWRKALPQWRDQIEGWSRRSSPLSVRFFDIFFDFAAVAGPPELAMELRRFVTARMRGNLHFLSQMWADEAESPVGRGLFGGFQTARHETSGRRRFNLKRGMRLQLVGAVRLLALREGLETSATPERIAGLHAKDVLSSAERADLSEAFELVSRLMLRQQLTDLDSWGEAGAWLDPTTLMPPERELLNHSMRAVERCRLRVRAEITGAVL